MYQTIQRAITQQLRSHNHERPPGPTSNHVMGILPEFARDPLTSLARCKETYGDIASFRVGPMHAYMINEPGLIEEVLLRKQNSFSKDPMTHKLAWILGQGLLTSEGAHWKTQRRRCAPSFKKKHIQSYAGSMVEATHRAIECLPERSERDVHVDMMNLTLDIVARTLFGASLDSDQGHRVGEAIEKVMAGFIQDARSWRRFLPMWVPTRGRYSLKEAIEEIDQILYQIIAEARAGDPEADHLLARLLAATDDDGQTMSDEQVRDEAVTLFVAGHETTALTLSYTLMEIAANPHVQEALHHEVDTVLAGRAAVAGDMARLTYANAVVKESMRLYPPAWLIGRQATEDVQIGDYTVLKGEQCMMSQWVMHRDERWFDDPLSFRPERWLDGLAERLPRFAFFPFGGGGRTCIGNHFAMMEATLSLATWMQHTQMEAVEGFSVELFPSITLRPQNGVRIHVERRAVSKREVAQSA